MTLFDAPLSKLLTVLHVSPSRPERASRLAAMGVVSGVDIIVRQRRPALIVEYGETTLAMDGEIAADIAVAIA